MSLQRIHGLFSEKRTVSKNLWPPRSPDLTTCDYFLWGHLKITVYESNPHTIQELKDISQAVTAIKITMLHRVYLNMIRRALLCRRQPLSTSSMMVYPFSIWLLYLFLYLRNATDPGYFFVVYLVLPTSSPH